MDYSKMTVAQLREECRKENLNGSNLKKNEIIDLLNEHSKQKLASQENNTSQKSESVSENSELEKIKSRITRFACKKGDNESEESTPKNVINAEKLQKIEERRRRFATRQNK